MAAVPIGPIGLSYVSDFGGKEFIALPMGEIFGGVAPGPPEVFKMRGRDDGRAPGSDYIVWIATGTPDFAGTGFAGGDPTPIGSLIAGSVVLVTELAG